MTAGVHELWERVQVEWENISKEECMSLIESMLRRIAVVLRAKGGYTKYRGSAWDVFRSSISKIVSIACVHSK